MNARVIAAAVALLVSTVLVISPSRAEERAKESEKAPTRVYVVNTGDASVSLVDLTTLKEVKRHKVGSRPHGIAVSGDGKTVAVGVEGEEKVKFFDAEEFKLKGETRIGKMFQDHLALTPDCKTLLVSNFSGNDVIGIDLASMKEESRLRLPEKVGASRSAPHLVTYGKLRKHAYVTHLTGFAIIDPAEGNLVRLHQNNAGPRSLAFSADGLKVYFSTFWYDALLEADTKTGKVTRMFNIPPPVDNGGAQEETYCGVAAVAENIVVAANEGRSCVDAVDVKSGKLLDRLTKVPKPFCVERVAETDPVRILVSNGGDGTVQLIEVSKEGKLKSLGKAEVGKGLRQFAFLPAAGC